MGRVFGHSEADFGFGTTQVKAPVTIAKLLVLPVFDRHLGYYAQDGTGTLT